MAVFKIPNPTTKRFFQANKGGLFGNIFATWNMDFFSAPGKIRISPQTEVVVSSDDDADMKDPVAFVRTDADGTDRWWALCGDELFKSFTSDPTSAWSQDAIANTPSLNDYRYSDIVEFNGALIVSGTRATNNDMARLSGGAWTQQWWTVTLGQSALTASMVHPLHVTDDEKLLIGDANFVHMVDTNDNVSYKRLKFPSQYNVTWIRSEGKAIWIGCRNTKGGNARVFWWDGYSENYNDGFRIIGPECYSGVLKNGIPYTVNRKGELLKFTGGGFSQKAVFPVFSKISKFFETYITTNPFPIGRNGMALIDNEIHITCAAITGLAVPQLENMLAGIWVYSEENGLHHRYSITKDTGAGIVDYGSPMIIHPGALVETEPDLGKFLVGARLYKDNIIGAGGTEIHVICYLNTDDDIAKSGYFITSEMTINEIEEQWQKLWLKIKKLANATDKIIVKYRTEITSLGDPDTFRNGAKMGTWSDDDTFTTDADLSNVLAGDEVEIGSGEGSGLSAKIESISEAGGTYTVNIGETVSGASGNINFRVSRWKQIGSDITSQTIKKKDFSLSPNSTWIQFKIILFGTGSSPEIEEAVVKSNPRLRTGQ
jgi:hypothetical protein